MHKMMEYNPHKRPTASQLLEHDYFKGFNPPNLNTGSKYAGGSRKKFFNPSNDIDTGLRKSSAKQRLESRKQKLESQGKINKNSFYNHRQKNPNVLGNKPTVNPYQPSFNKKQSDSSLPAVGSRGNSNKGRQQ